MASKPVVVRRDETWITDLSYDMAYPILNIPHIGEDLVVWVSDGFQNLGIITSIDIIHGGKSFEVQTEKCQDTICVAIPDEIRGVHGYGD